MKTLYRTICGAAMLCLVSSPGYTKEQGESEYMLETMTVTAQKQKENIQDVPMTISAFSDMHLNDAGVEEFHDIVRFSPNVYMKKDSIVIRGVSQYYGAKVSAVGFYQDGVALPFEGANSFELFDVERIEILKGPQGTLYGRNSEAGVVNIITKQPGNEFKGKVFGEYGWYDTEFGQSPTYMTGGSISGPLVRDKLYLGIAGKWQDDKGYTKNVYDGDEKAGEDKNYNGRLTLRWTPLDRWDITFLADSMNKDYSTAYTKYVSGDLNEGRHKISYDGPYSGKNEENGQTLRIKYSGDGFNVLSITGRRQAKNEGDYDFDLTSYSSWASESTICDESTNYSQEVRISSDDNNTVLKWLVGFYVFDEDMEIYQKKVFTTGSQARDSSVDNNGYAIFAQGTYTFFDRLRLTAGLRYDYTNFKGDQHLTTSAGKSVYGEDFDNSEVLPKLSASYAVSDNIMTYITAARGYLTGGYNFKWATNVNNLTYDPEYSWNYEVGMKSSWLDKRLTANISAFYIDMKDKQVAEWDTTSGSVSVKQIQNAANAYSKGVEFDVQARLVEGLDLFAGAGFIEAKIDDWIATEYNSSTGASYQYDYNGNRLPNVPEYTYNLGIQYRHSSGLFGRADLLGTGAFYSESKNTEEVDGYQLVNIRLGFEKENYDIHLWCKNVLDEEYLQAQFSSTTGIDGEPRRFGATVAYRF